MCCRTPSRRTRISGSWTSPGACGRASPSIPRLTSCLSGLRTAATSSSVPTGKATTTFTSRTGAASEELLYGSDDGDRYPSDWSRDGRFIVFDFFPKESAKSDIRVLPLFGDRRPFPYLQTGFNDLAATFSPDGHWLGYASDETGRYEVYVAPFPGRAGPQPGGSTAVKPPAETSSGPQGGKWQVSQGGGFEPRWKRDGGSLFYLAPGGRLMEASVKEKGSALEIGVPRQLFQIASVPNGPGDRAYTVAPDGQRFLINALPQGSAPEPLTLVTNWTTGLK